MIGLTLAEAAVAGSSGMTLPMMEHLWIIGAVYLVLVLLGIGVDIVIVRRFTRDAYPWKARADTLCGRPWWWRDLLRLLILVWVLHLTVLFGAYIFSADPAADDGSVWYLAQSVAFHWAALAFTIVILTRRGLSWNATFGLSKSNWKPKVRRGVALYLATIPVLVFYTILYQLWLRMSGHTPSQQDVIEVFMTADSMAVRIYLVFLAVILAPVLEEIVFRGIAFPVIARQWGVMPAVFIVSVGFALVHLHLPSFVPLFVMSAAFSLAYYFSESLLVPMVMHALFNGVNIGLLVLVRALSDAG